MSIKTKIKDFLRQSDRGVSSVSNAVYSQVAGLFNFLVFTAFWELTKAYVIFVIKGIVWSLFPMLAIVALLIWMMDKSTLLFGIGSLGLGVVSVGAIQGIFGAPQEPSQYDRREPNQSGATDSVSEGADAIHQEDAPTPKVGMWHRFTKKIRDFLVSLFFGQNLASKFFGFVWRLIGIFGFVQYQYPALLYGYAFQPDSEILSAMSGFFEWAVERPILGTAAWVLDLLQWGRKLFGYELWSATELIHGTVQTTPNSPSVTP